MITNETEWGHAIHLKTKSYVCGYSGCGREVASEKGIIHNTKFNSPDGFVYICPSCKRSTFFDITENKQLPGISVGNKVNSLPDDINLLWEEIRNCTSSAAYTSAVLSGRKMLMHIAVKQGATPGLRFIDYVDYLVDNHHAPPNSKDWVDSIRSQGNEATHELTIKNSIDASEIITFLEMLLKFIYEFPSKKTT